MRLLFFPLAAVSQTTEHAHRQSYTIRLGRLFTTETPSRRCIHIMLFAGIMKSQIWHNNCCSALLGLVFKDYNYNISKENKDHGFGRKVASPFFAANGQVSHGVMPAMRSRTTFTIINVYVANYISRYVLIPQQRQNCKLTKKWQRPCVRPGHCENIALTANELFLWRC